MTIAAEGPESTKVPTYQKVGALGLLGGLITVVVIFPRRVWSDFYPFDRSPVGPNLVASVVQYAIVLFIIALVWPPTRRRMHAFVDRKLAPIHSHLQGLQSHHEKHHEDLAQLHRKLDHIIEHHPDIPPLPEKGSANP